MDQPHLFEKETEGGSYTKVLAMVFLSGHVLVEVDGGKKMGRTGTIVCPGMAVLVRGDASHATEFAEGHGGTRESTQVRGWMATADLDVFLSAASTNGGGGKILPSVQGAAVARKGFWAATGDPTAFIAVLATTEATQEHLMSVQRAAFSRPDLEGPNNREARTIYSVGPTFNPKEVSDRSFPPHPWDDTTQAFA